MFALVALCVWVRGDPGDPVPHVTVTLLPMTCYNIPTSQRRQTVIMAIYRHKISGQERISPFQGEYDHYSFRL